MYVDKRIFPGRLNEIQITSTWFEYNTGDELLVFILCIDLDMLAVQFHVRTRMWDIDFDEVHFKNIPFVIHREIVYETDAVEILLKVLVEGKSKKAKHIKALKLWREKLKVFPAKVTPLYSLQKSS